MMHLSEFDYHLQTELIAQHPAGQRDQSRLLVLDRATGAIEHRLFRDLAELLSPSDVLVINTTKVIPARLLGRKAPTGADVEIFLLRQAGEDTWLCLVNPGRRLRPGSRAEFGDGRLQAEVLEYKGRGQRLVRFTWQGDFFKLIETVGHTPLPPYIVHPDNDGDRERYQTVYARTPGAVAAPTAGLHFTPELLQRIRDRGVPIVEIVLHVGWGTFKPVEAEDIRQHHMDQEYYRIEPAAGQLLLKAKNDGRRIVAVGTTTVRTLESFAQSKKNEDWTDIFIYPPYSFKLTDALITNFHLPKSTLLMLVSALAGAGNIRNAYATAIAEKYRFYSYGDAMMIV